MKHLLACLLFLVISGTVAAQQKYEYAIVAYSRDVPDPLILVSINGEKYEQFYVPKVELNGKVWGMSMNPLLKQVNKMQEDGWEVVGSMVTSGLPDQSMFYFTLHRKKP